jgi:hypothetical protein
LKNIKTIQIAFNLNDPWQKQLYEHVLNNMETNASNYGKLLIKRDMLGEWKNSDINSDAAVELDEDSFKGFI